MIPVFPPLPVRTPPHSVRPRTSGRTSGRSRARPSGQNARVELSDFQARMDALYGERDRARGVQWTVAWLAEEVGELARAVRKGTAEDQRHEVGDVLAWLASLANQLGLSLDEAAARYTGGCPKCAATPCACA